MNAGVYTFIIQQGSTFDVRIDYKDSNNEPIDLTEWHSRMHIRPTVESDIVYCRLSSSLDSDGSGLNMTPTSGSSILPKASGSIGIYISAASSSQFNFNEAYYDLEIYSGSGDATYVKRILQGKIKLSKEVTR